MGQLLDMPITNSRVETAFLFDVVSKVYIASDSQPVDLHSYELCSDMVDVVVDMPCIYGLPGDAAVPHDSKSSCIIQLNNGNPLYLGEVETCLALVCLIRAETFDRQHLVDHNINIFKDPLSQIYQTRAQGAVAAPQHVAGGGGYPG